MILETKRDGKKLTKVKKKQTCSILPLLCSKPIREKLITTRSQPTERPVRFVTVYRKQRVKRLGKRNNLDIRFTKNRYRLLGPSWHEILGRISSFVLAAARLSLDQCVSLVYTRRDLLSRVLRKIPPPWSKKKR